MFKKILLILYFLLILGNYNPSFSNWYGFYEKDYDKEGGTTECDEDGDETGGKFEFNVGDSHNGENICNTTVSDGKYECDYAIDINKDFKIDTSDYTSTDDDQKSEDPGDSDTMVCAYWDGSLPEEVNIEYPAGVQELDSIDIDVQAKDKGGSYLKKIEIYESENSGNWQLIKTWDNINQTNTLVSATYTKNDANNGSRYKFKILAYDGANNITEIEGDNSIKVIRRLEYEDNDNKARKELKGYVLKYKQKNIFWNNYKIEKYIDKNSNNTDSLNKKLGEVGTGYLNLEVDGNSELILVTISKEHYKIYNEIVKLDTIKGNISSGSGYIKNNSGNLELTNNKDEGYIFNFKDFDYMLFLTNKETNKIIKYKIWGITDNLLGIYINPIDDSNTNDKSFKILGYDAIINKRGQIIGKMIEMTGKK